MTKQAKIEVPEAPAHLSERSKELWLKIVPKRALSPGRLALLQTALESLDRAEQARLEVDRVGLTTTTKTTGAVHVHPLVKVERENRQLFARLWGELGLVWDHELDGRRW